jgi:membrane protein
MADSLWTLGNLSARDLATRVYNEIWEDDLLGSSAQLAYYFLFALFPLLIFLTSIFGMAVSSDAELRNNLFGYLGTVLPASALDLVKSVITEVSSSASGGKITLGLFLALWFASSGVEALIQALNRTYNLKETRPWWKVKLLALLLTVILALLIISALIIVLFGNQIVDYFAGVYGFGDAMASVWKVAQWLVVLAFILLAFATIYYFSPDVKEQRWYFVTPGSLVGVGLWLLVSFGFRLYLQYFDSYSATYGSLGAVIVLMLWLYFTGAAILIGGEINSEIENEMAKAGAADAKEKGEKSPQESSPPNNNKSTKPREAVL